MITRAISQWGGLLLILGVLGCSKTDAPPPAPLPLNQIQQAVQKAFANASGDVRASADEYVQSMVKHELSTALTQLQQLLAKPGLTADQRTVLAQAMMTTTQTLQEGASSGDQQAAQALHIYKATK
jgi:hypothetical protein